MMQDIGAAKDAALKLLASKRRSSGELARLMEAKGYEQKMVQEIVLWAKEYHFIDDAEYAKNYVSQHRERCSRNHMHHVLQERGVDEASIYAALEELQADDRGVLGLLFERTLKGDYSRKNVLKAARSFARKGFEYEDIQGCIAKLTDLDSDERMTEFEL